MKTKSVTKLIAGDVIKYRFGGSMLDFKVASVEISLGPLPVRVTMQGAVRSDIKFTEIFRLNHRIEVVQ